MEPDNITICSALIAYEIRTVGEIARVMGIDYDHARSLIAQVKENEDVHERKQRGLCKNEDFPGERIIGARLYELLDKKSALLN